jgi:predicted MPP superfamily phosphohydrolase
MLAAAGVARAATGRERFEVVERELVVPGLDARHDGLVVAQMSDVHLGASTPDRRVTRAIREINARHPDLVVLTGDYVTFSHTPLQKLSDRLAGLAPPTFAILGNHDHWVDAQAVRRALEEDGYRVLQNEAVSIDVRGAPVWIVGVDDAQVGKEDLARSFEGVPATGTRIVLAHQPTTADRLPANAGLVCFSGHTHGGQIVIPGLTSRIAKSVGQPYLRGLYKVRDNWLYVSAGIGYGRGGPALRVRNPPEIALITLRAG